ncbi:MAG: MFS transporter [Thermoplasmataceae archaeon]
MQGIGEGKEDGSSGSSDKVGTTSNLWYLCFLVANISAGLMTPLLPLFVTNYLHQNIIFYGITSASASTASVIALIFWGNLSDGIGKRKIFILIAFMGSFISLALIIFVNNLTEYIILLVSFQIFSMASVPVSTLLVIENSPESQWARTVSIFSMISSIGSVLGLFFGLIIVITDISDPNILKIIYLISAMIYLVSFVLSIFLLKEPSRKISRKRLSWLFSIRTVEKNKYSPSYVFHIIKLLKKKDREPFRPLLIYYLITCLVLMFAFQLFFIPFPVFMLNSYGASETTIYVMYLINTVFSTVTFNYASAYIRKSSLEKALFIPILIRIFAFSAAAALPLFASTYSWTMFIAIGIYGGIGAFWSIINITQITVISKIAKKVNRGRAIGYYNSILGVGQILAGIVSGVVLFYLGTSIEFIFSSFVAIIGIMLIMRKKELRNVDQYNSSMNAIE